ncbi:hypothetical protein ACOSQ2_019700 [Xanthoceras sorbifolium]
MVGLGIIVRDWRGKVMLSCVKSLAGNFSPEIAESLGVIFGLHVASDDGFKFVSLERDADSVVVSPWLFCSS